MKSLKSYVFAAITFAVFIFPNITSAQEVLYGAIGNGSPINQGAIIQINQLNGLGTFIGDAVTPGGLSGIDFDSTGRLFGTTVGGQGTNSTLVEIDPLTGSLISTIGGIMDVAGSPIKIGDLAFQPGTDVLYGIGANNEGPGGDLFTINTTNAVATFIGSVISRACGLAFAPNGTLYCWEGEGDGLHTVNPNTGQIISTIPTDTEEFIDALAVRADGTIFGSPAGCCVEPDYILTVDPANGDVNFIGASGLGYVSDLAFSAIAVPAKVVPTLSEWGLISMAGVLGIVGLIVIRRRKVTA